MDDLWGDHFWQSFGIAERRIAEVHDDYVVIQEVLLPDENGPFLMLVPKRNPAEWICRTLKEKPTEP